VATSRASHRTADYDADREYRELIDEFLTIRRDLIALQKESLDVLEHIHSSQSESAVNLLHYVALRSRDLRPLQMRLAKVGLSSLGRAESHVLSAVDQVLAVLHRILRRPWQPGELENTPPVDLERGQQLLAAHTEVLLGSVPADRGVAIMVTMPSEAANDYTIVHHLLEHGMDCMRVNCAHDDAAAWGRMFEHLRRAEQATGRKCRVLMDLAGPKLRTGPLEPGPRVVKVRPTRDAFGHVTRPARIWFSSPQAPRKPPTPADASLELPDTFLKTLAVGDRLGFRDARESRRAIDIVAVGADGCWAESTRTCYFNSGLSVQIEREGAEADEVLVSGIPPVESAIRLARADLLVLTREQTPGRQAACDSSGRVLTPATIGCSSSQVFEDVRDGERVWMDDGRIGGVVERREPDRLHVRITHTPARGAKLTADKGINLPDSELHLPAMTDKDCADLAFVAEHADMIALSFVNTVDDVRMLRELLAPYGDRQPAIVLKIETKRGFDNLPAMLLEAMKAPRCGVMIARGDLAVECGFERLAEVQEEILWICEAAHVPVIWATQVLESLAKDGQPSRAEITDAAMSHRAECVMLNKGPYVMEAVHVLDDILRRMHGHQAKKRAMLRELHLVSTYRRERSARHS
jgi:pyruvate kinase